MVGVSLSAKRPDDRTQLLAASRQRRGFPDEGRNASFVRPRCARNHLLAFRQRPTPSAYVPCSRSLAGAIAVKVRTATAIFDNDEVLHRAVTEVPDICFAEARSTRVDAPWGRGQGQRPLPHPGSLDILLYSANSTHAADRLTVGRN